MLKRLCLFFMFFCLISVQGAQIQLSSNEIIECEIISIEDDAYIVRTEEGERRILKRDIIYIDGEEIKQPRNDERSGNSERKEKSFSGGSSTSLNIWIGPNSSFFMQNPEKSYNSIWFSQAYIMPGFGLNTGLSLSIAPGGSGLYFIRSSANYSVYTEKYTYTYTDEYDNAKAQVRISHHEVIVPIMIMARFNHFYGGLGPKAGFRFLTVKKVKDPVLSGNETDGPIENQQDYHLFNLGVNAALGYVKGKLSHEVGISYTLSDYYTDSAKSLRNITLSYQIGIRLGN